MSAVTQDVMSLESAQSITNRIRIALDGTWELIRDAYTGRAWVALGYESWDSYTEAEFHSSRLRLPREERQQAVASLRDNGLSIRAIAAGLSVSPNTVQADLRDVYQTDTPAPSDPFPAEQAIRSTYGDDYVDTVKAEGLTVDARTGEVIDQPAVTEHTVTEKVKTVTGLDGKEYKRPEPRPSKPVLTGDDADRANAIQTSKAVGQALASLERFQYENARTKFLSATWLTGRDEVQPIHRALVAPEELRKVAAALNTLANEMESHDDYR